MKNNRIVKGLRLLSSLLLLTSCNLFSISYVPYTYEETFSEPNTLNQNVEVPETYAKHFYDVTRSNPTMGFRTLTLNGTGEQKLLVLPIYFSDYSLDNLDKNNGVDAHKNLKNAFFGANSQTMWDSVASYYYKSSYGKLSITGEVAPWFLSQEHTVASINQGMAQGLDKQTITSDLLREAVANFSHLYPSRVNDYDQDQDGYIDAVYVVYAYPYSNSRDLGTRNIFWAFATFDDKSGHVGPGPFAHNYAWSSYYFTNSHQTIFDQRPDTHTFIHEVTHLFGVPDYYNVNLEDVDNPLGGFDMMDYTIGDHTGLTKLLLEWTKPMIVTEPGIVKLRPFEKTGDLALIPAHWNGSVLSEYLLLEYYTPTGLNNFDSRLNQPFKLPNRSGLKVYHVDARTVYEVKNINQFREYFYADDYPGDPTLLYEMLAHTNSTGRQYQGKKPDFKLYTLLEKNGINTFKDGGRASENTLFIKGDSFGFNTYQNFAFNQGNSFPYRFIVSDLNNDYISIDFTAK